MTPSPTGLMVPDPMPRRVRSALVAIESHAFEASAELVHQRGDLAEAASPENNRALAAALTALESGDVSLARQQIRAGLDAESREDEAIRRAETRRQSAHGHTRSIASGVEQTLTGRSRRAPIRLEEDVDDLND